ALRAMPSDARLGLLVYGHRRARDCRDIELVSPIGADDAGRLAAQIRGLQPRGETPIAAAIEQAARSFAPLRGQQNSIVLVTDGVEECKGDPCAAARAVRAAGLDLKVSIVGFTLGARERQAIECVARETGGAYYDAADAQALTNALTQVRQQVTQAPPAPAAMPVPQPPARVNILARANGGELLAAPSIIWAVVHDGKEDQDSNFQVGQEAVFAFRGEQPYTFDTFTTLVTATDPINLREFELLAGDDGPTGTFRSIGVFTAQNLQLLRTPYQEFRFPPVTARYLKVRLVSNHGRAGNWVALREMQLFGEPAVGPAAATAEIRRAPPARSDILAQAAGGELLAAPSVIWGKLHDGKEDQDSNFQVGQEAVFAFRGEQPHTFDTFTILVTETDPANLREFELLAGDEGPAGAFRSIGVFSVQNLQLLRTPYQEFRFAPVTARYLKVKLVSNHGRSGNWIALREFRLFGRLADGVAAPTAVPVRPPAPARTNILAQAAGGELLAAPSAIWAQMNDGKEEGNSNFRVGQEAVFAFRGEQPHAFDTFATLVTETDSANLREFELLVGDDGPTGAFRSIGVFAVQNVRLARTPYQEFTFAPVTARYLKVRLVSNHGRGGDWVVLREMQVFGQPAAGAVAAAPATARPATATRINILGQANGGELLAAPAPVWAKVNDGKDESDSNFRVGQEGVFAFRDERPHTFHTFATLVVESDAANLREFELLVADESPAGPFRSIGAFAAQNLRLHRTPYQEFTFAPVTAKYLKVKLVSNHGRSGGWVALREFQVFGAPAAR
ncbi:MAG: hypothetical protein IT561_18895, partial [Alphaproteobacteria bacterium]|nr:hypothetical protein [Alphaproteobacteria bacterium]